MSITPASSATEDVGVVAGFVRHVDLALESNNEARAKCLQPGGGMSIAPASSATQDAGVLAGLARHGDLILESDTCLMPTRVIFLDPGFRGMISIQVSETALVSQLLEHLCQLLSQPAETVSLLYQGWELDPKLTLAQRGVVLPSSSGRRRGSEVMVVCSVLQKINPTTLQRLLDECPAVKPRPLQARRCPLEGTEAKHAASPGCYCGRPPASVESLEVESVNADSDVSSEWYNVPSLRLSQSWCELSEPSGVFDAQHVQSADDSMQFNELSEPSGVFHDHRHLEGTDDGMQLNDEWTFCLEDIEECN